MFNIFQKEAKLFVWFLSLWKGPAKEWEKMLLSLGVDGNETGIEGEEIAPLAKENIATPWWLQYFVLEC